MSDTILWTRPMLKRFRRAYHIAAADHKESFEFDDHEFVTSYAKYLLKYLDSQFNQERTINVSHNN